MTNQYIYIYITKIVDITYYNSYVSIKIVIFVFNYFQYFILKTKTLRSQMIQLYYHCKLQDLVCSLQIK